MPTQSTPTLAAFLRSHGEDGSDRPGLTVERDGEPASAALWCICCCWVVPGEGAGHRA